MREKTGTGLQVCFKFPVGGSVPVLFIINELTTVSAKVKQSILFNTKRWLKCSVLYNWPKGFIVPLIY